MEAMQHFSISAFSGACHHGDKGRGLDWLGRLTYLKLMGSIEFAGSLSLSSIIGIQLFHSPKKSWPGNIF